MQDSVTENVDLQHKLVEVAAQAGQLERQNQLLETAIRREKSEASQVQQEMQLLVEQQKALIQQMQGSDPLEEVLQAAKDDIKLGHSLQSAWEDLRAKDREICTLKEELAFEVAKEEELKVPAPPPPPPAAPPRHHSPLPLSVCCGSRPPGKANITARFLLHPGPVQRGEIASGHNTQADSGRCVAARQVPCVPPLLPCGVQVVHSRGQYYERVGGPPPVVF